MGRFSDEGFSAYSGNRGPGLEAAKAAAVDAAMAHGSAVLVAQHSDRVARGAGDAPDASDHLVEVVSGLTRHKIVLRTVQDDYYRDPKTAHLMAAVMGQRNTEDSRRKSEAVTSGLKRRKESGQPVGHSLRATRSTRGSATTGCRSRPGVVDQERMDSIVIRAMERVEAGFTFGDVARRLNAEGLSTRRGKQWRTRAIREIVLNEDYTGTTGYPQVIDRERWERIVASLKRLDPVAVQSRRKGKKPTEDYLLRGIASCGYCGSSLRCQRYKRIPGERAYICAAVKESRGTCDASKIPAAPVEKAVIDHLGLFLEDAKQWINDRAQQANGERERFAEAIGGQRTGAAEARPPRPAGQRARGQVAGRGRR